MDGSMRDRPALDSAMIPSFGQLVREARSRRLGVGFVWLGWFHCLIFACCEFLYLRGDRAAIHYLPLWGIDLAFAVLILRHRLPITPGSGERGWNPVALRVWLTFAILCFSSASLNSLTGFEVDWFKISWSLLGTFAFATMAWIFHLAFLIPAVQMSLTGLLIAACPRHSYLIFGVSWLVILNALGCLLEIPSWKRLWTALSIHDVTVFSQREPSVAENLEKLCRDQV